MIVHLAKLQKALSENSWVRTPTENLEIENAAREYLRQQQAPASSDDRKAAIGYFKALHNGWGINPQSHMAQNKDEYARIIEAALQQPKDEPVSEERREALEFVNYAMNHGPIHANNPNMLHIGICKKQIFETIRAALAAPQQPKEALEAAKDALDLIDCVAVRIDDNEYRIDHDTFEKVRQALAQINAALEATE